MVQALVNSRTKKITYRGNGELPYKPDDDQLATVIVEKWQGNRAYFHSAWHGYEAGSWRGLDVQEVKVAVRRFLRQHRQILATGVSQSRITSLTNMLEDELFVSDRKLIQLQVENAKYINLQNGLFNLETFELEPHRRDLYFTTQLEFAYDPDAECPNFRKYLNTSLVDESGKTDQDMVALVQEALAYSMTARTDLKASFWLVGVPESGKSTLISFIRALMGSLHGTIDLNQLGDNRFLLSGIVGKRVVTFTEADTNIFIPDALYKAMVGGKDEIYVDVKNKPGIAFVPTAKFWWAMNNAPRMNDRSGATLNRLRIILFTRTFAPHERILYLDELLLKERAGVFNWLMYGYRRLNRAGKFTAPARSEAWRETYRMENDTEATYAQERWEYDPKNSMSTQELYNDYRFWCDSYGYKAKNMNQVAKEWRRLGLTDKGYQGLTRWHGAKLKNVV